MCGIAGQFSFTKSVDVDAVRSMGNALRPRGPDDVGHFVDGPVSLAHRRLSIIDLHAGKQPLFNEDGTVAVIFNGEIYNYCSLRSNLSSRGHQFTTDTDTETLVHLYEDYGVDLVNKLRGIFAFALWDADKERLLLARDPIGIKPLIVGETANTLSFASELDALLTSGFDHGGLDRKALSTYFAFGYIPAPRTAFQKIKKLRPGERMVVDAEGAQRDSYYKPKFNRQSPGRTPAAEKLQGLVENSVKVRLMSDVPLGVFLSGGIDSSIVTGTMAKLVEGPIRTFTVGFQEDGYDESWAAREVANFYDTDHYEFIMAPEDARVIVPNVLRKLGEPFADQSLIPSFILARETSKEVKVALSGDGADELFGGYDKYRVESLAKYYKKIPSSARNSLIKPLINHLNSDRNNVFGSLVRKGQWFVNREYPPRVPARHFELMRIYDTDTEADVFVSTDPGINGQKSLSQQYSRLPVSFTNREALTRIQAVDTLYSLPNQILNKVDLAGMFNSLEVRVPFLDTSIVEYALSLPRSYKITTTRRKHILKQAFKDKLPNSIVRRNKQGFDMPIGSWFRNELYDDFLNTLNAVNLGILDDAAVESVLEDHVAGNSDHSKFLWSVYVYKYWAAQMCERGILNA